MQKGGGRVRLRSRSFPQTSKEKGSIWTKRATLETTSCFPNAGSREVSLLWFQRGIKVTAQNQTIWGSLYMWPPPRARQIPWRLASLPDRSTRSRYPHPRAGGGVRWLRGFLTSKSAGSQNFRTFALAVPGRALHSLDLGGPKRARTAGKGARRL